MKKDTRVSGVVVIGMSSDDGMCVAPIVTQATRSVCTFNTVRFRQDLNPQIKVFRQTGSFCIQARMHAKKKYSSGGQENNTSCLAVVMNTSTAMMIRFHSIIRGQI
jgi:hypothetical protein